MSAVLPRHLRQRRAAHVDLGDDRLPLLRAPDPPIPRADIAARDRPYPRHVQQSPSPVRSTGADAAIAIHRTRRPLAYRLTSGAFVGITSSNKGLSHGPHTRRSLA